MSKGRFTTKQRRAILDRDDCACAGCGRMVANPIDYSPFVEYSIQHRLARGSGGTSRKVTLADGIILCGDATSPWGCHYRTENNPEWARARGYRVDQGKDPSSVPVIHAVHGVVLLTATGGTVSQEVTW